MSNFSSNDLVFYKENDQIMSGGYLIDSILLKQGISPMTTLNQQGGNKKYDKHDDNQVSSIFENLAVPAGLLYTYSKGNVLQDLNDNHSKQRNIMLDDEIHDEFIKRIEMNLNPKRKNKKTKKQRNNNKNKQSKKLV
jgi:hypothetical protein